MLMFGTDTTTFFLASGISCGSKSSNVPNIPGDIPCADETKTFVNSPPLVRIGGIYINQRPNYDQVRQARKRPQHPSL